MRLIKDSQPKSSVATDSLLGNKIKYFLAQPLLKNYNESKTHQEFRSLLSILNGELTE